MGPYFAAPSVMFAGTEYADLLIWAAIPYHSRFGQASVALNTARANAWEYSQAVNFSYLCVSHHRELWVG